MATFVLVPGGWSGAWTWRHVVSRLETAGHRAVPLTLTGLGERSHLLRRDIDLDTHVADVVNALVALGYSEKEALVALKGLAPGLPVAEAIRAALKALAK